jgi:hypothetical protein
MVPGYSLSSKKATVGHKNYTKFSSFCEQTLHNGLIEPKNRGQNKSWWIGHLTIPGPSSVLFGGGCVFVSLLFTAHLIDCAQLRLECGHKPENMVT